MKTLIHIDTTNLTAAFTKDAEEIRETALTVAAPIAKVETPQENELAIEAIKSMKDVLQNIEKARKAAIEKPLALQRAINDKAKEFIAELNGEFNRIQQLTSDFAAVELRRKLAEEAARNKELADLERKRQEELAKAKTVEQVDLIDEKFNAVAQAKAAPVPEAPKPAGQVVRTDWEITVQDVYLLAKYHPHCVKITPLNSEIKMLLDEGLQVRGVKAEKVVKAGVRVGKSNAITV